MLSKRNDFDFAENPESDSGFLLILVINLDILKLDLFGGLSLRQAQGERVGKIKGCKLGVLG